MSMRNETMTERIIAIGDVHGCHAELSKLLSALSPVKGDTLVMLGDLVNRGPDSRHTVQICVEVGALAILGNHERRLLRARSGKRWRKLEAGDLETYKSLGDTEWAYLEKMSLYYYAQAFDTVFVHGGFMPGMPWREQGEEIVTMIQVIDAKGRACKRSDAPVGCPSWSDLWKGPPFVVYGHTPWHQVRRTQWTLGLDTGCVYGGALSALVLPSREIVQVRAAKAYHPSPSLWRQAVNAAENQTEALAIRTRDELTLRPVTQK
jgi:serine/threonine protein phosphatase 1